MDTNQTHRIHPKDRTSIPPSTTPLSIIDSSVANYTPCGTILIFPPPPSSSPDLYSQTQLIESLSLVLDVYPQWSGYLHIPPYDPTLALHDHTRRFGRVHLSWGNSTDPGVGITFQTYPHEASLVLPLDIEPVFRHNTDRDSIKERIRVTQNRLPMDLFINQSSLIKLRDDDANEAPFDKPIKSCVLIKVTTFSCGSVGIALGMHHVLGDASTLSRFIHDWSEIHHAQSRHTTPPLPTRPFNPLKLDSLAAGNLDSDSPNPEFISRALTLTQLRLDFWASGKDKPRIISSATSPHPDVRHLDEGQRGTAIPWDTWDWEKEIKDYHPHFTPGQVQRIWEEASMGGVRVSRLDAMLGFLWRATTKARCGNEKAEGDEIVYLDNSVGLRKRLNLGDDFLGSPLINVSTSFPTSQLLEMPLSTIAKSLRSTTESADAKNIRALLHRLAFVVDPITEWNAFMGKRHLMVTSWLWVGLGGVDFEGGRVEEREGGGVEAMMWGIDGLVVVMDWEGACKMATREGMGEGEGKWYDRGVRFRVMLQVDVMKRLLRELENL